MIPPIDFSDHVIPDLDVQGPDAFRMASEIIEALPERFAAANDAMPSGIEITLDVGFSSRHLCMDVEAHPDLRIYLPVPDALDEDDVVGIGVYMAGCLRSAMRRANEVMADPDRRRIATEIMLKAKRGGAVAARLSEADRWIQTTLPSAFGPAVASERSSFGEIDQKNLALLQTMPPCLSLSIDHDEGINFSMSIGPAFGPCIEPADIDDVDVLRAIADGRL